MAKTLLRVTASKLRPEAISRRLAAAGHGAQALFVGVVRSRNQGKTVKAVSYEVDGPLTLKVFVRMAAEARKKWGRDLGVGIAHRRGRLRVGEASVVLVAASSHRREALEACAYLIEELKRRAPIWKKEHYVSGDSAWLPGCSLRH